MREVRDQDKHHDSLARGLEQTSLVKPKPNCKKQVIYKGTIESQNTVCHGTTNKIQFINEEFKWRNATCDSCLGTRLKWHVDYHHLLR